MASNFQQHMGGPGQMMQQRMPQQRPPQGNQASLHVQQVIYNALSSQTGPLSGWQAQVLINERITLIFNIIGNLRLASQHQPNAPPLQKMVEIGIKFEKEIFEKCASKDQYKHEVQVKLEQLLERRNQQQATLQQTIQQQAQAQAQQAQAQQMMMNQNMPGQGMAMPQQPGQQSFAHLQHPMQASPLPGQQSQQNAMGMQNPGLPQNPAQNQQQAQFQLAMQQQQNQSQQPQNVPGRPGGNQANLTQQENSLVSDLTNRLMAQTSEEDKNNLRARLRTQMDPASFQKCQAQGMDPIILYFRQQAIGRLRAERSARAQIQLPQNPNMPAATPMQQQRSMQPSPAQAAAATGGNPDFSSFMGNMENLAAQQQQQGVMAEQQGQMVVPANSGAPRNTTPQPGVMAGQGMNMNDQRGVANANPRAQQQQMFNAQQLQQQQRLQHAQAQQQQHSQAQARLNAQKNAAQLHGQPGGMGPGPVPQQSPAMQTLNAPMRTPSQQNHPELPQTNPNAQFGQPIDPRFMQGNQRQPGQTNGMNAGLNQGMFANMGQGLAPDKLNEVVNKWNGSTNPGARPGMPMQNPQARPGMQIQQPGQMNAQNQAAQFAMTNPGQRPPPNMMNAMNPQQQLILQQQMANLRPGQMPQRTMPPNVIQMEQRNMMQMDAADIPTIFLTQQGMPQGFPPEIKKWGQLKQWVNGNPNLGPNALEGIKNFQRLHFQQLMQRSRLQQGQPGMPQNQPGMPGVMPGGGSGMPAPVAPMGPNPMMNPGMTMSQLRQPTPQEIQTIRNHPSGKLANASDDQIRTIFMTNQAKAQAQAQANGGQLNPQQQEQQRQQMLALKMKQAQMQQHQNSSQPQSGQAPQPNMTSIQNQAKPIQTPQPKPAPTPKTTASTTTPNQPARPQSNVRNANQNASPAPPVKSLKRQNSDDVVEVPNPNLQQQSTPQQTQNANNAQARPKFTPQQLAQMPPEARKRYEALMRMNPMGQAANGQNTIPPAEQNKLREISKQEEQDSQHNLQDIPMDPETKQKMRKMLESIVSPLQNVFRVVSKWFQLTLDEEQARKFFRARYRLAKQFQDNQMTRPKENFSIYPQEVEQARALLGNMVKDLTAKYPDLKKPNATKAQAAPQPQPVQAAQPQTPLNAANLQQQQQQLSKQLAHQRSNSRSSHTPAAPTSSQPPFQLGATSPHGAPVYAPKNTLDVDKLHIPARKKQKQSAAPGQGTPGSISSPQVAKAVSPEMKRQQQPETKQQQRPALCCKEPDCERHQVGFDNEEDLKKHTQEEHIGPLENPDKFVQDNLASLLGLDPQGQPKKPAASTISAAPEPAPKMTTSNSKQGQTPTIKAGTPSAATPMMRQASMNRQASASGAKPNAPSKGTPVKEAATKAPEKDIKQKENQIPAPAELNDPWAEAMIDPNELFGVFQPFETGAGGAISDMNVFRGITPNDTPESSKDGVSEPNSDISDGVGLDINLDLIDSSWQPFGPSDTEGLGDLNFAIASDEDLKIFDEEPPLGYPTFDDVDASMFDKPFSFDTALFSFDG